MASLRERALVRLRIVAYLIRDACVLVRLDAPAGSEIPSLAVGHEVARWVESHRGAARASPAAILDRPLLAVPGGLIIPATRLWIAAAHVVVDVELVVAYPRQRLSVGWRALAAVIGRGSHPVV